MISARMDLHIGARGRHELIIDVCAPAFDLAIGLQATGVRRACGDLGKQSARGRAFACGIIALTGHGAAGMQTAGMDGASGNLQILASRHGALANSIAAPTDDLTAACDTASKIIASLDLDKGIGGWRALTSVISAPTIHSSIRAKCTGMKHANSDLLHNHRTLCVDGSIEKYRWAIVLGEVRRRISGIGGSQIA
jgi:outer membrane murein-binding lipoprotein Lpp